MQETYYVSGKVSSQSHVEVTRAIQWESWVPSDPCGHQYPLVLTRHTMECKVATKCSLYPILVYISTQGMGENIQLSYQVHLCQYLGEMFSLINQLTMSFSWQPLRAPTPIASHFPTLHIDNLPQAHEITKITSVLYKQLGSIIKIIIIIILVLHEQLKSIKW